MAARKGWELLQLGSAHLGAVNARAFRIAMEPIRASLQRSEVDYRRRGRFNKETARLLDISPETVNSQPENVFAKLAVECRARARTRAARWAQN